MSSGTLMEVSCHLEGCWSEQYQKADVCLVFDCHELECTPWKTCVYSKREHACNGLSMSEKKVCNSYLASLCVLIIISLFHLLCNCFFSPVKEFGDGWTDWTSLQTFFSKPSRACAQVWLAEETKKHHEKLAAAVVCAAWGPALLL